jgi:hypothetical protein
MHLTRPSTRLHAPPGGKSSISFGSHDEPPASRRVVNSPPRSPAKAIPAPAPIPAIFPRKLKIITFYLN